MAGPDGQKIGQNPRGTLAVLGVLFFKMTAAAFQAAISSTHRNRKKIYQWKNYINYNALQTVGLISSMFDIVMGIERSKSNKDNTLPLTEEKGTRGCL